MGTQVTCQDSALRVVEVEEVEEEVAEEEVVVGVMGVSNAVNLDISQENVRRVVEDSEVEGEDSEEEVEGDGDDFIAAKFTPFFILQLVGSIY